MLRSLDRAYERLLRALMVAATLYLAFMLLAIIYQTVFRSLGIEYSGYAFVFVEYGFIYIIMLGAPWLVRERAHILIELLTAAVSPRTRTVISHAISILCAVVCLLLAWYGAGVALEDWQNYELDVRGSRDVPRWIVTVSIPLGFALMAVEFLRFVVTGSPMHTGEAGVHE